MTRTIINSTIALTTAFLLTIILHELAHYVMSISLDYDTTLFHNKVVTKTSGIKTHEIMIAGIAPLFSLAQGIIAYTISKAMKPNPISLLILWLGIAGIITFFGYLMIAPIIPIGDTGKVFSMLNIPMIIQVIISILALLVITILLMKSTKQFEKYAIKDFGDIKTNRKKWSISLILIPLLISIILITIFQFPIPHIASILATVCAPFSIMAIFGTFIGGKNEIKADLQGNSLNKNISIPILFLLILTIIVNRMLVSGI
ncbi:hypothetical protein [Lacinutrix chionoecetis]